MRGESREFNETTEMAYRNSGRDALRCYWPCSRCVHFSCVWVVDGSLARRCRNPMVAPRRSAFCREPFARWRRLRDRVLHYPTRSKRCGALRFGHLGPLACTRTWVTPRRAVFRWRCRWFRAWRTFECGFPSWCVPPRGRPRLGQFRLALLCDRRDCRGAPWTGCVGFPQTLTPALSLEARGSRSPEARRRLISGPDPGRVEA